MASTTGDDDYRYQRYVAMSIQAERAARGWSINELADRAGIDYQTLLRKLNLRRHLTITETARIAEALGITLPELLADAERRKGPERPLDPADEAIVDAAKLTARQRQALKDELRTTHMDDALTTDESLRSDRRRMPPSAG